MPRSLPALQRAARLCGKAVSAGFRWDTVAGALAKVHEELAELEEALPGHARVARDLPDSLREIALRAPTWLDA